MVVFIANCISFLVLVTLLSCSALISLYRCWPTWLPSLPAAPHHILYWCCCCVKRWNLCTGVGPPVGPYFQLYLMLCFGDTAVVLSVEISVQVLAHLVVLTASWILLLLFWWHYCCVQSWYLCTGAGPPGYPHCQLYLIPCFGDIAVVFSVEISVQVLAHLVVLTASCILFLLF